jgi:hypothetical protein
MKQKVHAALYNTVASFGRRAMAKFISRAASMGFHVT